MAVGFHWEHNSGHKGEMKMDKLCAKYQWPCWWGIDMRTSAAGVGIWGDCDKLLVGNRQRDWSC